MVLVAEGRDDSTELGRRDGDACLLELMPLPNPSTDRWLYADVLNLPHPADREADRPHYGKKRATHLKGRVAEHNPRAVIFYGFAARRWWQPIAGVTLDRADDGFYAATGAGTTCLAVQHPVAHGVRNDYFGRAGELLRMAFQAAI